MRAVTLITGASGGIGADLARVFARQGHDLALVARSRDKLDALATEIAETGRRLPIVIACDLAEPGATDTVVAALAAAEATVTILINNAGYGRLGAVAEIGSAEQLGIVDLNIRSLLELTLAVLPQIRVARGRILNVASVASFMPGPGMAVYYASKAFVSAFSRALTQELKAAGVGVSVLHPGMTRTGFQSRAGMSGMSLDRLPGATSASVAEAGYAGLMAGRRTIVPGLANKLGTMLLPLIPDAILLPVVHRFQSGRT